MLFRLVAALILMSASARAEPLHVVTDIAPVHSLVAMVMEGVAEPDLLLAPGTSAHHFALKPSQARTLAQADLVIWIGPSLTPPLAEALVTLAPNAARLVLSETQGTLTLPYRELDGFGHEHDHGEDAHAGEDIDPHLWLAPENAQLWLGIIADALAEQDPDNALNYKENAVKSALRIENLANQTGQNLSALKGVPIAVFHDAFQYFEHSFDLTVIGALSDSEAAPAGPAFLDGLRDRLTAEPPACILLEPGANRKLVQAIAPDVPAVELDPMGTALTPGSALYPALIEDMAKRLADCAN